jgi:hypothetical protein
MTLNYFVFHSHYSPDLFNGVVARIAVRSSVGSLFFCVLVSMQIFFPSPDLQIKMQQQQQIPTFNEKAVVNTRRVDRPLLDTFVKEHPDLATGDKPILLNVLGSRATIDYTYVYYAGKTGENETSRANAQTAKAAQRAMRDGVKQAANVASAQNNQVIQAAKHTVFNTALNQMLLSPAILQQQMAVPVQHLVQQQPVQQQPVQQQPVQQQPVQQQPVQQQPVQQDQLLLEYPALRTVLANAGTAWGRCVEYFLTLEVSEGAKYLRAIMTSAHLPMLAHFYAALVESSKLTGAMAALSPGEQKEVFNRVEAQYDLSFAIPVFAAMGQAPRLEMMHLCNGDVELTERVLNAVQKEHGFNSAVVLLDGLDLQTRGAVLSHMSASTIQSHPVLAAAAPAVLEQYHALMANQALLLPAPPVADQALLLPPPPTPGYPVEIEKIEH